MIRNRYMVNCATLVIAVHDGRKTGGTAATIQYAHKNECIVREINLWISPHLFVRLSCYP